MRLMRSISATASHRAEEDPDPYRPGGWMECGGVDEAEDASNLHYIQLISHTSILYCADRLDRSEDLGRKGASNLYFMF